MTNMVLKMLTTWFDRWSSLERSKDKFINWLQCLQVSSPGSRRKLIAWPDRWSYSQIKKMGIYTLVERSKHKFINWLQCLQVPIDFPAQVLEEC
jgi:hypothetical protein